MHGHLALSSKPLAMYNERLFWTSLPTASDGYMYVHTEISVYSQVFPVDLPLRYIATYIHSALLPYGNSWRFNAEFFALLGLALLLIMSRASQFAAQVIGVAPGASPNEAETPSF